MGREFEVQKIAQGEKSRHFVIMPFLRSFFSVQVRKKPRRNPYYDPLAMVFLFRASAFFFGLVATSLASTAEIDFNRDVRPILNRSCTACHGGVKQAGGVSFIIREQALALGDSNLPTVLPFKPEESELLRRILLPGDDDEAMPPKNHHAERLPDEEVAILRQWIEEGAVWGDHWSFVLPEPPVVPEREEVANGDWARSDLDLFVLREMSKVGLSPNEEGQSNELLRRLTFGITGLPPTIEELAEFDRERVEEKVDDLLSRASYGENWGSTWLDLASYADSMGYEKDIPRIMWPYRDWVINALNEDLPYDQFIIKQLAGDLLPEATLQDHVATAFLRNSQTNTEGGTDDEEFRIAALVERIGTTWTAVQGLTFQCIQCHAHPYDPFPHQDFFEFAAYYNNLKDADLPDDFPTLKVPLDGRDDERLLQLQEERDALLSEIVKPFRAVAAETEWQAARPVAVESNLAQTKLVIGEVAGQLGVVASGNLAQYSRYQVTLEAPKSPFSLTALRLFVPLREGMSQHTPDDAFVVNSWELRVHRQESDSFEEVAIGYLLSDEVHGRYQSPEWGAYPNQFHEREAIIVLSEALTLQAGDEVELVLNQDVWCDGGAPPVLRQFHLSFSDHPSWSHRVDGAHAERLQELAILTEAIDVVPGELLPILAERTEFPRTMAIYNRGNFLDKTTVVQGGTPGIFPERVEGGNRLDMAKWMTSKKNPLTARVMVNRVWAKLFGAGLVATEEDFGSTGHPPSHPELLDYLALRFQEEHAWSVKALVREIVLSATFRQSAAASASQLAIDPSNRLLSRGPRQRLSAEMVRDHALKASGLLSEAMGGEPVMPPQPEGVWKVAYSSQKWTDAPKGDPDRYRRALYTYWRRGSPYPSFQTFDAPERRVCSARRITTNTPLQALTTLNDPVYHESSQALARMLAASDTDVPTKIREGYRRLTSREPDEETVTLLVDLYEELLADFATRPAESALVADTPATAALVVVCNTLLNLDSSLTW